jgi:uncharacterized ferritin-like protein (DUF455 family)
MREERAGTMNVSPEAVLFAEGPARDARFTVRERWIECDNLPGDHPLHLLEFVHRQMNEEVDSLESSARSLGDFPMADWAVRMGLARQCADEARHAMMFRRMLEQRGGRVGQFPVLNFQYRIVMARDDLVGRLAVQNRCFEAGGLDAIAFGVGQARAQGDAELAEFYEAQLADEIVHVRFANDCIREAMRRDPRTVLRIGTALSAAAKAFRVVMGREGTEGIEYPVDAPARLEAGFKPDEVQLAAALAVAAHSARLAQGGAADGAA